MNIHSYLERIQFTGNREPSIETLHQLQLAHLYTIPFENLSIHHNEPIELTDEALFAKVITRKRGGFCYELNGLFSALLSDLGFSVIKLSAQVANKEGGFSAPFDHMALLVTLKRPWLVDVGFGDTFRRPLPLHEEAAVVSNGRFYRITQQNDQYTLMEQKRGGMWQPQYRFTQHPYDYADYEEMCHYHQTSPDSHFRQSQLCTLATPKGRVTVSNMRFITTTLDGMRQEEELADLDARQKVLQTRFGIPIIRGESHV